MKNEAGDGDGDVMWCGLGRKMMSSWKLMRLGGKSNLSVTGGNVEMVGYTEYIFNIYIYLDGWIDI